MEFTVKKLKIEGLLLIKAGHARDERGAFSEIYKSSAFRKAGIKDIFVQENYSVSKKGVLRGLHYQLRPFSQTKLVRCVSGRVFDVAVDLRRGSKTFGKWRGAELSADNCLAFYIPAGFAHGFLSLEDGSALVYKCSTEYAPAYEAGIRYDDPALGIKWPAKKPRLSAKDKALPFLKDAKL